MNSFVSHRSKGFRIALLLLVCVGIYAAVSRWWLPPANEFRKAMERGDFVQAEKLWKRGVLASTTDPYAQFMRIRDRIQAVSDTKIESWKVLRLQTINETNRYFGEFDIQDPTARFGVGLIWEGEKWELKPDYPELPPYVKRCLN
jgi:hypothetical protein